MTDLVEFLRARLDEDEHEARDAIEERQRVAPIDGEDFDLKSWPDLGVPAVIIGPERLLAEVEAKRRIIDLGRDFRSDEALGALEEVLGLLALPYVDHPDFQESWRVG